MRKLQVVFDRIAYEEGLIFVEVEEEGKSISFGEWKDRPDGYRVLEIEIPEEVALVHQQHYLDGYPLCSTSRVEPDADWVASRDTKEVTCVECLRLLLP